MTNPFADAIREMAVNLDIPISLDKDEKELRGFRGGVMIGYLLIDGRKFLAYKDKWRVFLNKDVCLAEARKLGYGSSIMGAFPVSDVPGRAVQEQGGNMDITIMPIEIQVTP